MGTHATVPTLVRQPSISGAPASEQLHVQFGADAAREVSVSWVAAEAVVDPRLRLGAPGHGLGIEVAAEERSYVEVLTGERVFTYHARLRGLTPDSPYDYEVFHRGATPVGGTFRTAPAGRERPFRFTAFGDQSVSAPVGRGVAPWSPNAGYVVDAVEAANPLFHLLNGDLCYANLSDSPVATWASFCNTAMRSARHRAWMPCPGNHENEVGNGAFGYRSYQTRFALPSLPSAAPKDCAGNWYAFTAGPVRVISINNDDVCLQDGAFSSYRRDHVPGYRARGDDPYIRGYSEGAQRRWLQATLAAAREDPAIDWIVVCMHQVAVSSAHFNGADLGIRLEWLPLFDRYQVDLVIAGHEHHYERTFPIRGVVAGSSLLTPAAQGDNPAVLDTRDGTVHMTIGGGGHPAVTPLAGFETPPQGVLIVGVGPGSPASQRPAITTTEPAAWSAHRDLTTPYGFAAFDVQPAEPGGMTTITVTYFGAQHGSPHYQPLDRFVLRKPVAARGSAGRRELVAATAE